MKLLDTIMPPTCVICAGPITGEDDVMCPKCRVDWDSAKDRCRHKHLGVAVKSFKENSGELVGNAIHIAEYEPNFPESVVNRLIYRLKRSRDHRTAKLCAKELAVLIRESEAIPRECTPIITWVPRRIENVLLYGKDHMRHVAKALSRELALPCRRLLVRGLLSSEQKTLGRKDRVKNAQRSIHFARNAEIQGKTILLIDDIITTGASMEACARLLMERGARTVIAVAIAATERHEMPKALADTFLINRKGIKNAHR